MTEIKWENEKKNLCVVCDKPLTSSSFWTCQKCNKVCEIKEMKEVSFGVYDVKSKCCKADVTPNQKITCSDKCHDKLTDELERKMGQYKKITDQTTNITYRVPTKAIIENGIRQEDLKNFPEWTS